MQWTQNNLLQAPTRDCVQKLSSKPYSESLTIIINQTNLNVLFLRTREVDMSHITPLLLTRFNFDFFKAPDLCLG